MSSSLIRLHPIFVWIPCEWSAGCDGNHCYTPIRGQESSVEGKEQTPETVQCDNVVDKDDFPYDSGDPFYSPSDLLNSNYSDSGSYFCSDFPKCEVLGAMEITDAPQFKEKNHQFRGDAINYKR